MKKELLVFLLIILVLIIILGIKILVPKDTKTYTGEEIKNKILSAFDYTNYTYEYIQHGEKTIKKVRGSIIVTENDKNISWVDGNSNTAVSIDKEKKQYVTFSLNDTTKELVYKKDFLDMQSLMDIYGNDFYYISNENYRGRNCLRVQPDKEETIYLVDEETGFILKYEPEEGNIAEFNIEINNVKEEDVKMPDLSEYTRAGS